MGFFSTLNYGVIADAASALSTSPGTQVAPEVRVGDSKQHVKVVKGTSYKINEFCRCDVHHDNYN